MQLNRLQKRHGMTVVCAVCVVRANVESPLLHCRFSANKLKFLRFWKEKFASPPAKKIVCVAINHLQVEKMADKEILDEQAVSKESTGAWHFG